MEYLVENLDWLKEELDRFGDEDFLFIDCPGQVTVFFHLFCPNHPAALRRWSFTLTFLSSRG